MFESAIPPNRPTWILRMVLASAFLALVAIAMFLFRMIAMPLKSYSGQLPALTVEQSDLADRLSEHVRFLTTVVRERNLEREGSMQSTIEYLRRTLVQAGYSVAEQTYTTVGGPASNLEVQIKGTWASDGEIIVGAHYDAVEGTVGADDNASGVAATLELARLMAQAHPGRTIRFVFFANEEPPYFQTEQMGSLVYAKKLRSEGAKVTAMISLEMLGFYSDTEGSQNYPAPFSLFYPSRGNFVAFVGDSESRGLVRRAIRKFRESARFSVGRGGRAREPARHWMVRSLVVLAARGIRRSW